VKRNPFDNIHTAAMRRGRKKDRSELQHHRSLLLHKLYHDPLGGQPRVDLVTRKEDLFAREN
jgi:hypothetical protein